MRLTTSRIKVVLLNNLIISCEKLNFTTEYRTSGLLIPLAINIILNFFIAISSLLKERANYDFICNFNLNSFTCISMVHHFNILTTKSADRNNRGGYAGLRKSQTAQSHCYNKIKKDAIKTEENKGKT